MLTCLPQSVCSWDYRVSGDGVEAELTINWGSEQGCIAFDGTACQVVKHGPFSGRWTLERDGQVLGEALKPAAMFRELRLMMPEGDYRLEPPGAFTRAFYLARIGATLPAAIIAPMHPFTRRATIQSSGEIPHLTQLFAFWLVAVSWRRQQNNS